MSLDPVMPPYNASDPNASFVGSSCLDFLLIELVPLAYRVAHESDAHGGSGDGAATATDGDSSAAAGSTNGAAGGRSRRRSSAGAGARGMEDDEELDAVHHRLEAQGYRVGQGLVERYVCPWKSHCTKVSSCDSSIRAAVLTE